MNEGGFITPYLEGGFITPYLEGGFITPYVEGGSHPIQPHNPIQNPNKNLKLINQANKTIIFHHPKNQRIIHHYYHQSTSYSDKPPEPLHNRLKTHEKNGRLEPGTETRTEVKGGKTAREIVEHKKIQEKTGGVPAKDSDTVSNKRDPIGPKRRHLVEEE